MTTKLLTASLLVATSAELLDPAKYTFSNNAFATLSFEDGITPSRGPSDFVVGDYPADRVVEKDGRNVLKMAPGLPPVKFDAKYFQLGKQDFTVEFDWKRDRNGGNTNIFRMLSAGCRWTHPDFMRFYPDYLEVKGRWGVGCGRCDNLDWSQWNRIAVSRQGTSWGLFINGIQRVHKYAGSMEIVDWNPDLVMFWTVASHGITGWVDNFEFSKFAKYEIKDITFYARVGENIPYAVLSSASGGASSSPTGIVPTNSPTPSPTVTLDEITGIKQCCAKNVPIQTILPSLTCADVRGKTDEDLRSHIRETSMTIPQIIEWLKAQKCLHTSSPTHVCRRTTCSYSEIEHNGMSYWHTLVRGDKNHAEHYHCEKHIHDGDKCECLCNEEFTCTIVHHFKKGRTDGKTAPKAITQENCAPPGPTNAPTTAPTPAPTPVPTGYPTYYPTPFPTPHPCDDGSHGCDKSANGICYKAGGNGYTCGCRGGYHCTQGCSAPHNSHTCALITPAPTNYPTRHPTGYPTLRHDWYTGRCTACPSRWYQHCHGGYQINERGCGFLGCEARCRAHGH